MLDIQGLPDVLIKELSRSGRGLPSGAGRRKKPQEAACCDCSLPYSDPGFADLVVPNDVWAKIGPSDGGLLCPTCIVRRVTKAGLGNVQAAFRSGPFACVETKGKSFFVQVADFLCRRT